MVAPLSKFTPNMLVPVVALVPFNVTVPAPALILAPDKEIPWPADALVELAPVPVAPPARVTLPPLLEMPAPVAK